VFKIDDRKISSSHCSLIRSLLPCVGIHFMGVCPSNVRSRALGGSDSRKVCTTRTLTQNVEGCDP
jgi:hypothetical protein